MNQAGTDNMGFDHSLGFPHFSLCDGEASLFQDRAAQVQALTVLQVFPPAMCYTT
uniref:Uncharacterized protein n=1 Tax=Anguilla anguilla TaxID=7936 RepID=A0A0E9Q1E9_ANGAN